ncbi:MAG: tetratricopeptide repeat protein [candidate division NC10 bacterium]
MLRLSIFGTFRVADAFGNEIPVKSRKARALLAYLALPPGKPRSREQIMALLWSDRGDQHARSSLRQALSGLRKDLGEERLSALRITDEALTLDPARVVVEPAAPGDVLLDGLHLADPAFEDWLRDERLRLEDGGSTLGQDHAPDPPGKPAIAVLPFVNLPDDPEQLYFSDGLTEDIMTELSRFRSLDVVARNSTFVYRDQAVNASEIGEKVGASHLLEGSVRKSGNRIRLTAQLIDAKTGRHVWADRYDRELADIFALQDELVHSIVAALAVRLSAADTERSLRKPAINLAAYDLYLRAVSLDRLYNVDKAREAKELASQAVALDPGFARAYTVLSAQIYTCGWFENVPRENYLDEALRAAAKSVELDPDDSFCLANLGVVHLQRREYDQARHYFELALRSNPHDTWIWADYAWFLTSTGKSEEALERLDSQEIFEPYPPSWHWEIRGQVLYMLKRYGEARTALERMTVTPFWSKGFLAACCGQLGELEAAERYWAEALESAPPRGDPTVFMSDAYRDTADVEHWLEGLRKAELVE